MANNKSKIDVIKRRADFESLRANGRRLSINEWLLVSYKTNDLKALRIGWTIPTYVGTAVVRNRLKRLLRVATKDLQKESPVLPAIDVNFVFKKKSPAFYKSLSFEELSGTFAKVFSKISRNR